MGVCVRVFIISNKTAFLKNNTFHRVFRRVSMTFWKSIYYLLTQKTGNACRQHRSFKRKILQMSFCAKTVFDPTSRKNLAFPNTVIRSLVRGNFRHFARRRVHHTICCTRTTLSLCFFQIVSRPILFRIVQRDIIYYNIISKTDIYITFENLNVLEWIL